MLNRLSILAVLTVISCSGGAGGGADGSDCAPACNDAEVCADGECVADARSARLIVSAVRAERSLAFFEAPAGQWFILVTATLQNDTSAELPLGPAHFSVKTASGLVFLSSPASASVDDPCPDAAALASGSATPVCTTAYAVPVEDAVSVAIYDDLAGLRVETALPEPQSATCPVALAPHLACADACNDDADDDFAISCLIDQCDDSDAAFACGRSADACACLDVACPACIDAFRRRAALLNACQLACR